MELYIHSLCKLRLHDIDRENFIFTCFDLKTHCSLCTGYVSGFLVIPLIRSDHFDKQRHPLSDYHREANCYSSGGS